MLARLAARGARPFATTATSAVWRSAAPNAATAWARPLATWRKIEAPEKLLIGNKRIPEDGEKFEALLTKELKLRLKGENEKKKYPKPMKKKVDILAAKRKWKIVTGDTVVFIGLGPEKGKTGVVKKVNRKDERVTVENLNVQRQEKLDENTFRSSEFHEEVPVHYSDVSLIDPEDGKPTRVRYGFLEDGTKVRISCRTKAIIPFPPQKYRRDATVHPRDTPADVVLQKTFST